MSKWIPIILISLLVIISVSAADCCIDSGVCTEYPQSSCQGSYTPIACENVAQVTIETTTYETPCKIGCCCALDSATDADAWNTGTEIEMTKISCEYLYGEDYIFKGLKNNSCDNVCETTTSDTTTQGTVTISGTVTNKGNPLEAVEIFIPTPTSSYTTNTDSNGDYSLEIPVTLKNGVIQAWTGIIYAHSTSCNDIGSQEVTFDDNKKNIDFELECESGCSQDKSDLSLTADYSGSQINVMVKWNNKCESTLKIKRTISQNDQIINTYLHTAGTSIPNEDLLYTWTLEAADLKPNTEYCFTPLIIFESGTITGDPACVSTGDEECLEIQSTCKINDQGNKERFVCEEGELIEDPCGDNQFCVIENNEAKCITESDCDKCNGLFGILGSLNLFKTYLDTVPVSCDNQLLNNYCFENQKKFHSAFESCSGINSCEDYLTKESCNNDVNSCDIGGCSWQEINSVGLGFCRSEKPQCDKCDDIFGVCSDEMCFAIGDQNDGTSVCYSDIKKPSHPREPLYDLIDQIDGSGCRHKDEMACAFYKNEVDCNNNVLGFLNVNGNNPCVWKGDYCISDNDGSNGALDDVYESEWDEIGSNRLLFTLNDHEAPTTTLLVPGVEENGFFNIGLHEIRQITYIVNDNVYTNNEMNDYDHTYFEIKELNENCDIPTNKLSTITMTLNEGDTVEKKLCFASKDPSGNQETPKFIKLKITNYGIPILYEVIAQ